MPLNLMQLIFILILSLAGSISGYRPANRPRTRPVFSFTWQVPTVYHRVLLPGLQPARGEMLTPSDEAPDLWDQNGHGPWALSFGRTRKCHPRTKQVVVPSTSMLVRSRESRDWKILECDLEMTPQVLGGTPSGSLHRLAKHYISEPVAAFRCHPSRTFTSIYQIGKIHGCAAW